MNDLKALSIKYCDGQLSLLDQQLLPHAEEWIHVDSPEKMIFCIQQLKVRGAPLIGVAAALCLAQYAESGCSEKEFLQSAEALRASRPTAVNLMIAIDRLIHFESHYNVKEIVHKAENFFREDIKLCQKIAENGAELINDGDRIITHCNTGGLATAGVGTALGVIQKAAEQGKKIHVYVDETRPLLQGGRLTTWELKKLGIPYTLICDNMAASLMAANKIDKAIVGSDRIALNGDFANKVGTYSLAINCHFHQVPFFVAAPYTTIDFKCKSGEEIPIEQRDYKEVRGVKGSFGEVLWAPKGGEGYNPAFDVTPRQLVSYWILDNGVFNFEQVKQGALHQRGH